LGGQTPQERRTKDRKIFLLVTTGRDKNVKHPRGVPTGKPDPERGHKPRVQKPAKGGPPGVGKKKKPGGYAKR